MHFQTNVAYSPGVLSSHAREMAFTFEADDEASARVHIANKIKEIGAARYEIRVLAPVPTGPFTHGEMTQAGFRYPCACWMDPAGTLHRCQSHERQGGPGNEAIVEAITALGLLKETRPECTCETCGAKAMTEPYIGPYAGRFAKMPNGWETEEWQRVKPRPVDGRSQSGRSLFCSRRCRGEWLIKTSDGSLRRP